MEVLGDVGKLDFRFKIPDFRFKNLELIILNNSKFRIQNSELLILAHCLKYVTIYQEPERGLT